MDDLRLALFVGPSGAIISLADYLALDRRQRGELDVTPSAACISLIIADQEQWGPLLSFGALGLLAAQFPQARDRLVRGERAVIRGAGFDSPVTEYVVFDPTEEGMVMAATAATDAPKASMWLPHERDANDLYRFVGENLRAMLAMGRQMRELTPVPIESSILISALGREVGRADEVIALIGPGVY